MKYSEANRRVKGWDTSIDFIEADMSDGRSVVLRRSGRNYMWIVDGFDKVLMTYQADEVPYEAIKLLIELHETPVEEREDEKKYYIKVASIDGGLYLNYVKEEKNFTFSTKNEIATHQTQFTKQEVNSWLKATTLAIDWDKALEEVPGDEVSDD
ncbi:hypothetical protein [Lactobacillus plantarum] [Lactiplantibacillus mudanjiangensis]|uniref:hypothetical protein n=1 Tax=Lactiplantibacillus mudanjiangensis TaxID=1296538 RepID=UPI001014D609|nr:hypothetical protein [Lactobacillus plantarum] [Lactiplantibacillus mudanjiangensis]